MNTEANDNPAKDLIPFVMELKELQERVNRLEVEAQAQACATDARRKVAGIARNADPTDRASAAIAAMERFFEQFEEHLAERFEEQFSEKFEEQLAETLEERFREQFEERFAERCAEPQREN